MPFYSFRYERKNVRRISLTLLSIGCAFDDMVNESIARDIGDECLKEIIRTVKDLITQTEIKIRGAVERA